ncbi:amino acid/amide ABC transporter membrane protein 2, HAAT family [Pyrobaculum islandicum DSM 4184]|uniref:Amino acid/amide ABC transporter membrane protein 2, HAAT family n=1 Tax=Pyrobaculum islandicum (strain DSM 4184 / JCM 9189 / GEO3) TaxID=384616 RepID=A1RRB4_PYRIL|nr:branched-chain amino acid ABC transporter permease [Pyrobaculum islandicum]ABL87496.1 amino acid/amide ABC transporter membrane protein 2, HAAT family [Pyrobaculum islandicum DSM 4184]
MKPLSLIGLYIYLLSVLAVALTGLDVVSYVLGTIIDVAIFTIIALSVNLEAGIGGIPNFGKVLTVTAGAFIVGGVISRIAMAMYGVSGDFVYDNPTIVSTLSRVMDFQGAFLLLLTSLVISLIVGAVIGVAMSAPAVRLREDYLAITLLAFGDFLFYIGRYYEPLVGGTFGVSIPPIFEKIFGGGVARYIGAAALSGAIALLIYLALERIIQSPYGRALKVHREDPELVEVFGRKATALRLWAMAIGGAVSAVAGALYALYAGAVHPSSFTRITFTFYPWLIMILGGMGNNLGVVNGVFIFVTMRRLVDMYKYELSAVLGFDPVWLAYMVFGALALAIIAIKPEGLVPEESTPLAVKRKVTKLDRQGGGAAAGI